MVDKNALAAAATSIRSLSMDAVQAAGSGHPGLPLGLAELGALLYAEILRHNPADPAWPDRDRLILSAGHGCMLLYAALHLAGYDISLDDIKRFRQQGSRAAGHPEHGLTPGVETTTGPLGQGVANAVGMAIAERMLAARFNTAGHTVVDHFTYVIAGDGCMMEGITSEAASLAGHLGLAKLIAFYDSNGITIEGSTDLAFSEDVAARYRAYGWQVQSGSAYELPQTLAMVEKAKAETRKPSLIVLESVIGKGSANKAGSAEAHGTPFGETEVRLTRKALGIGEDTAFYVAPQAVEYFQGKRKGWAAEQSRWEKTAADWSRANPELARQWKAWHDGYPVRLEDLPTFEPGSSVATRNAGGAVLNALADVVPNLIGGSADLASSNKSDFSGAGDFLHGAFDGRNMHFGVREHAMGAALNGMALHGGIRPYGATFLVFADYMRPAIRLAAMMKLPVIYIFTHDSINVGEDGPTHQPVEQLASLRVIPNVVTLRPADAAETAMAWKMALERTDGPTALALSRQNLKVMERNDAGWRDDVTKGACVVRREKGDLDLVVVATGSEVNLALDAVEALSHEGIRVVSMISRELFQSQAASFRDRILPPGARRLIIEAGVRVGWEGLAGADGELLTLDRFGESAPAGDVSRHLGFDTDHVVELIRRLVV